MRALEWAGIELSTELDEANQNSQEKLWWEAFNRWELISEVDVVWDMFKSRIRQINDPALTTGFARRFRSELPQAFDWINARLAFSFAQLDRASRAEWHINFLKCTHDGADDSQVTILEILTPVVQAIERHLDTARRSLRAQKPEGIRLAENLLKSCAPHYNIHRTLLNPQIRGRRPDDQRLDGTRSIWQIVGVSKETAAIGDEIAGSALMCAVAGYNVVIEASENDDDSIGNVPKRPAAEAFLAVLKQMLPLASNPELTARIKGNISTVQENRVFDTQVRPLMDRLLSIQNGPGNPETKLTRVYREILPKVDSLLAERKAPEALLNQVCDNVAALIRGLGVEAFNTQHRSDVAARAINVALDYVKSHELRVKLLADQETLSPIPGLQLPHRFRHLLDEPPPPQWTFGSLRAAACAKFAEWLKAQALGTQVVVLLIMVVGGLVGVMSLLSRCSGDRPKATAAHQDSEYVQTEPQSPPWYPKSEPRASEGHYVPSSAKSRTTNPPPQLSFDDSSAQKPAKPAAPSLPPELSLPSTGVLYSARAGYPAGPLSISTDSGSGNYYVKLVSVDTESTIVTLFIRDGQTITRAKIPAGTYEMRYACGDKWYGPTALFGEDTTYNKADSPFTFTERNGYTVELYKQVDGNLSTSSIDKEKF